MHPLPHAAIVGVTLPHRLKALGNRHVEVKGDLIHQLAQVHARHVAVEVVFVHEAQPVHRQPPAGFLEDLANDGLLGGFAEPDAPAHGIEVIVAVVPGHQKFAVFQYDRADPEVHQPIAAGHRHIVVHTVSPSRGRSSRRSVMERLSQGSPPSSGLSNAKPRFR